MSFRRVSACLTAAATIATFGIAFSTAARAAVAQPTVVSPVAATNTPDINDGVVYSINQVGSRVIVGGSFTNESAHGSSAVVKQSYVFAFDATSGALDPGFKPVLDGHVEGIAPGPTADTVYLTGYFTTVNGVKSKTITLLDTTTGHIVTGFKPSVFNGAGYAVKYAGGRLYVGGTFTTVGGVAHSGLASLNPTTGALSTYLNVQLAGHHNYNGSGANGAVGPRAMAMSPDGKKLIVIGNFKNADGVLHDQIVWLDLSGSTAVVRSGWNTAQYTAACFRSAFDTYMRGVDWAPDGSYFVVVSTGGSGTNTDGTRSLCDTAARFELGGSGASVMPTWVDYTGQDTLLSVAVTGTAVYVGGHERWFNNSNANDSAGAGSVPRPGMAALDPANGLPLAWNPGRNPRGAGAYAMFASPAGLYVGSDTDYFGNYQRKHGKIGFFPLKGGTTPAPTTTAALPANVYATGPRSSDGGFTGDFAYRPYAGSQIGASTTVAGTGVDWSTTRGAFAVGDSIFFGRADGTLHKASFDGSTVGPPVTVDPYADPAWSGVSTGSGQTYRGQPSAYYRQLPDVTAAFFDDGRLYYTLTGQDTLYYRYFTPDSGIIGATQFAATGATLGDTAGAFVSGGNLYYASRADGTLHRTSFAHGVVSSADTVVSGPAQDGNDWRARSLFAYGEATFPAAADAAPVGYIGQSSSYAASTTSARVSTPTAAGPGDTELLFVSTNVADAARTPAGWTVVATRTATPLQVTVYRRAVTAGDAGTTVTVPMSATTGALLQLAVYRHVDASVITTTAASDSATASHTAPATTVPRSGSTVISFWADKSATTTAWTLPAGVTSRTVTIGTGGGRVSAALADDAVGTGAYAARTATVNAASGKGVNLTLVLRPSV